jgi:sugar phosphate isomerase/epimerase
MLAVLPTTQETSRMPSPALTFSTGSLYLYSLDRCFALAAACGFDGVEVICDQRYDTRQPDNLRRLMDTYGIPVLSLHAPFLNGRLDGWESGERAAIEQTVALAEAIDARHVVMHLPNRIWYMTSSYALFETMTTVQANWREQVGESSVFSGQFSVKTFDGSPVFG